jgi:hypothetical protein
MPPRFVSHKGGTKKLWRGSHKGSITHLGFWCCGCESYHAYQVKPVYETDKVWSFNGDEDNPTFSPSLVVELPGKRCHLFVRDGKIEYLADCSHHLAGKTVELLAEPPEISDG